MIIKKILGYQSVQILSLIFEQIFYKKLIYLSTKNKPLIQLNFYIKYLSFNRFNG